MAARGRPGIVRTPSTLATGYLDEARQVSCIKWVQTKLYFYNIGSEVNKICEKNIRVFSFDFLRVIMEHIIVPIQNLANKYLLFDLQQIFGIDQYVCPHLCGYKLPKKFVLPSIVDCIWPMPALWNHLILLGKPSKKSWHSKVKIWYCYNQAESLNGKICCKVITNSNHLFLWVPCILCKTTLQWPAKS